ncbi:MAG: hypothetical protein AAGI37_21020 [Planctomycetota bacterium]
MNNVTDTELDRACPTYEEILVERMLGNDGPLVRDILDESIPGETAPAWLDPEIDAALSSFEWEPLLWGLLVIVSFFIGLVLGVGAMH